MINDFFEKIYCINLDRRPDRWERASNHFEDVGIIVERFSAIDGTIIDNQSELKNNGAYGCALSHRDIIIKCKLDNVKNVLILEDDVVFRQNFQDHVKENFEKLTSWDMIYLGGQHKRKPLYISDGLFKLKKCLATHAYAVSCNFYDEYLKITSNMRRPIDVNLAESQSSCDCYVLTMRDENYTCMTYQEIGYSDIEKRNTCYHRFFQHLKNYHDK
jgi:GR25 family glycosyltransferase involved in LPS biosynthesis